MSKSTPTPQSVETFVRVRVPEGFEPADFAVKLEEGVRFLIRYREFGVRNLLEAIGDSFEDYYYDMDDQEEVLSDEERARLNMLRQEYVEKPSGSQSLDSSDEPARVCPETGQETPILSFGDLQKRYSQQ